MSHILYLVRHGIAEPTGSAGDASRRLTAEGVRKMRTIAKGLKRLGVVPDVILSSPLQRAEETAAILAAELLPSKPVDMYDLLAPGHTAEETAAGLRPYNRSAGLMLVGHQPDLGRFAAYLLAGADSLLELPLRKGGAVAIEIGALPARQPGSLVWFLTPAQLRLLARKGG